MSSANQFDWVPFYQELAGTLLSYKSNRQELVEKVNRIFEMTDINMPTLEKDKKLIDIDPFTVFGLFNKTQVRMDKREKIVRAVAELFSVVAPIPTSFDGIPLVNPQNATFYYFVGERDEGDIDALWDFFEAALNYAEHPTVDNKGAVSKYFDLVINKKGNGNSKITMGLYWIAPDTFLNLDSRNQWYIYEYGDIPEEVVEKLPEVESKISAEKYFEISDTLKEYLRSSASIFKNFIELSFRAWVISEKVNDEIKAEKMQTRKKTKGAAIADENVEVTHYWLYAPGNGAIFWDEYYQAGIMAIGWGEIGDLTQYSDKKEMQVKMKEYINPKGSYKNCAHATWQFLHDMKKGDIVFAKKGNYKIVGRGVVTSDYEYDDSRGNFGHVRKVNWTHKGEWDCTSQLPQKTLTDMTPYTDFVSKLNALFETEEADDVEETEVLYPKYDMDDFLTEVFMDKTEYETLVHLVKNKMNVILEGPPGVGKTYAAKRLAYSMMGEKDTERVMMVQFHQSYSYEDFIMGIRPTETGYELRRGVFYNFCKMAETDSENDYFFIIDEINRGNLSKIFGELFMLIENDKRDIPMQLLYANEKFSVPSNLYIIGMMNTADRSLAMLDYALRRRFAFFEMKAGFETDGFREYRRNLDSDAFNRLIDCVESLNAAISSDESLGEGFCIGHSYFCNLDADTVTDDTLSEIVEYELIPMLKEYWFDEPVKVKEWSENLRRVIQ